MPGASRTSPAETRSNNSDSYTSLKSHIPWPYLLASVTLSWCLGFTSALVLYPEWPYRQCGGLVYPLRRVHAPVAAASLAICSPHLHRAIRGAQGVLPCLGLGVTPVN